VLVFVRAAARRRRGPRLFVVFFAVRLQRGGPWDGPAISESRTAGRSMRFMDSLVDEGFVVLGGPLEGGREILHAVSASSEEAVLQRLAKDNWARTDGDVGRGMDGPPRRPVRVEPRLVSTSSDVAHLPCLPPPDRRRTATPAPRCTPRRRKRGNQGRLRKPDQLFARSPNAGEPSRPGSPISRGLRRLGLSRQPHLRCRRAATTSRLVWRRPAD